MAVAASLVAGVALWLSRASFDVAGTVDAPQRVAMLPALPELAGLIVLCFLLAAGAASLLHRRGGEPLWNRAIADVLMPLFALGLLALPYVPWLPDWIPALRLLAGPGRAIVWAIVLSQVTWLLLSALTRGRQLVGPFASSLVVFAVSLAVYAWTFSRVASTQDAQWPPFIAAAVIAALVWRLGLAVGGSKTAATFAWAAVCLSAPFVLNSREIFPGALVAFFDQARSPANMKLATLVPGCLGLLFDQEYGLFSYAPVLLLAFIGLAGIIRNRSHRRLGLALSLAALLLLAVAGSQDPWWSEYMMPGRTVLLTLPLLGPPLAWLYARTSAHAPLRAAAQFLLLASLSVTLIIVLATDRVPVPQEADGSSSLLQWMSPTWRLWHAAPTYIASQAASASARAGVWLAGVAIVGWLFSRWRIASPGFAALSATSAALVAFIAVASTSAALPSDGRRSRYDLEGRTLFPMLETFDPVTRPLGVKYDPLSVVNSAELPPLFSLSALPGQRDGRQPLRVALNARFRLPAGEYEVDLKGSDLAGTVPNPTIGLQVGREGRALAQWPFPISPGAHTRYRFRLPLDAEFVGFRVSREVERMIAELRLRPLEVVETRRRFRAAAVRSAAHFGSASVFFHDGNSFAESEGFWVRGRTTANLTILKPRETASAVTLAIHSGPRPNAVTLATRDWSERIELVPGVTRTIVVPSTSGKPFIPLSITSRDGFVPAEIERRSRDRRLLGAWVAFSREG